MKYLIIGSGPAGIFGAEAIRRRDAESTVTMVSPEDTIAYSPVIITYWIGGKVPQRGLYFRDSSWADQNRIELKLGQQAISLQTRLQKLTLESGEEISYDRLLIASGSSPVSLPIFGVTLKGVHSIRRVGDAEAILAEIANLHQAIIIGGGFVGLKVADHLKERGIDVMILEKETRLVPRIFDGKASLFLVDKLGRENIRVETGVEVEEILGKAGRVCGVRMKDGRIHPGQMVIQSVGVRPNINFLAGSGIAVEKGVPVNTRMETNITGIYAAGDVTLTLDSITGEKVNNATWPAASRQGTVAGMNMAGGNISCPHNLSLNAFSLCGVPVMTAGNPSETNGQALMEEGPGFYRKILLQEGKLTGFILIGEVSQAGILLSLMKKREIVSGAALLQKPFSGRKYLPPGYGYQHGSLFLRSKWERS
ncbi:MAG: NAD(P)/FAD-dependent oxidoreductase [Deltaproteobacteria bacterium]|nr:NAD(P)/FAD-dependent oxidoreductase [Deltaproteobacteria bacterium]